MASVGNNKSATAGSPRLTKNSCRAAKVLGADKASRPRDAHRRRKRLGIDRNPSSTFIQNSILLASPWFVPPCLLLFVSSRHVLMSPQEREEIRRLIQIFRLTFKGFLRFFLWPLRFQRSCGVDLLFIKVQVLGSSPSVVGISQILQKILRNRVV